MVFRDSLIAQVLRGNPKLRALSLHVDAANTRMRQVRAWDDPQFGIELYNTPVTSLNPLRDGEETDYFLQQTIPFPGKKGSMEDLAYAGTRVLLEDVEESRRMLIAEVKRAYISLYTAQRRIDINDSTHVLLVQMMNAAAAQAAVGRVSQGDLLKIRVEIAKLENDRGVLEHDAHVPEAWINTLRDLPMDPIGRLPDASVVPFAFDVHALVDSAFQHRPALRRATMEVAMAKAEQTAAQRERLPDFMVRANYKRMASVTSSYALLFGVTIPFAPWASGKYDAREEERTLQERASEATHHDRENMVEFEVHDSWVRARTHWEESERYRTTIVPLAEQSFRSSLSAFQSGRADVISLLDSFRTLRMYQMEYFTSLADYLMHIADLEYAVGITLDGGAQ